MYNNKKTIFFLLNLLRWSLVNSNKKEEHSGLLHLPLALSHGHYQSELFIFGKRKKYIQQQSLPWIRDFMACNRDVPKVTMSTVLAAATSNSQLIFLLLSDPERNENNIGKQQIVVNAFIISF